jgi:UDP-N-acetylglucosamine--N-acetylmuramyl-(pentapeptide) pyrophosphoryl-undecaprenol N-acetylglucosamine transferase
MTRVIISGGGTGGHVFPAIAIANALRERIPGVEILFIGARGKLEMEKVPAAGYPIEGLWISGLQRRISLKNLLFPVKVIHSTIRAGKIIRRFHPSVVVGVGGYASGPTVRSAARKKIPTLIQEQNSYPGITNRLLAGKADRICVAYEGMERFFPKEKLVLTGNPVRQDILVAEGKREEALAFFGLDRKKKTVLALGGSLGARTINLSIRNCLREGLPGKGVQFLWQTGPYYYDSIRALPEAGSTGDVRLFPFLDRMDLAFAAADAIVSRAGAIAISELCIAGKPVILIPSPNVAEDHQTKNAMALAGADAAVVLRDADAAEKLPGILADLIQNEARQAALGRNIRKLAIRDAATRITDEILALIRTEIR